MQPADVPLEPLDPLTGLLPAGEPFTPALATKVGVSRSALTRMLRAGVISKVCRGVYVDATAPDTATLRARALGLVAARGRLLTGRTAAWVHGVEVPGSGAPGTVARQRQVPERDVMLIEGVRVTTPLRTALDLGRALAPDRAIAALDEFLRKGLVRHPDLLAEACRFGGRAGVGQLRSLVAMADGRATCAADSVLRLRWYDARLPTPIPRLQVGPLWVELGVATRRFGAVLAGRLADAEMAALEASGWRVVVLSGARLLQADPAFVIHHLEREFHQHLLDQVG